MKRTRSLRSLRSLLYVTPLLVLMLVAVGVLLRAAPRAHASDSWTTTGSLNVGRYYHTATLLLNGQVLVTGSVGLASAELYDPTTGSWTPTGSMNTARFTDTATLLPNGEVLVAGGEVLSGDGISLASAELYDPTTGSWTPTGSMNVGRREHTATLLPNGQVLVAGGEGSGISGPLATAELYNPTTGTWAATGSMSVARLLHTATLLPNGRILVAGGYNGNYLASAELYDPSMGTWSPTGAMNGVRGIHTATLLPTGPSAGRVLVAGGVDNSLVVQASAELYDPGTGSWTPTGSMSVPRAFHTATVLDTGQVLIAGGERLSNTLGAGLASAELYDPVLGNWASTASMSGPRELHTATLLPNGRVLVAGGVNGNGGLLASAEVFALDTTAPTLSLPGTITVPASSPAGAVVTYAVSASDPDDPTNQLTVTCSPASGSTFPIGTTPVSCSAHDPSGNTASASFQVVVTGGAAQLTDLISLVNSFHLAHGLQTSLDAKLQATLAALQVGDSATACGSLTAFTNEVQAQAGQGLTASQAQQLLAAASRIEAVLGC